MTAAPLAGLRILLVEDEYLLAMVEAGAENVRLSGAVSDALDEVETNAYSLALLDVNLRGGETAFPIADRLLSRDIPFGFITGCEKASLPPRFARFACWQKPVDHRSLIRDIGVIWGVR